MNSIQTTIKTDRIYEGRILNLRVDTVEMPDKKYAKREIVEHQKGVGVIAFDGNDKIRIVKQYRKAVDSFMLEIPAGLVDANEDPIDAVKREMQEEIGYDSNDVTYLFDVYSSPGFTNSRTSLFVAKNLFKSQLEPDEDEFIEKISLKVDDLYEKVLNYEISDSKTVIGILIAKKIINDGTL
ncbi:MAG: NUDIX hydrolase [Peptoniphilaceae bacterium]|nr:NUDIX hydrolase [Peptoniphilaceae bacterium]MDD7382867.1 NUDIX hydrolase [Peptoniphilaceae bacterium]MDY3738174.1 NUDIX hydrolase [Peptoniphilaceae bacterium]